MKKILFIFGTRPEAIKMAPLIKETGQSRSLGIEICVTGQHREMLDQVLKLFDICPDYDLNIMQPGQDLYDITSRILINLRDILQQSKPDLVLVHGDTTTSMAGLQGLSEMRSRESCPCARCHAFGFLLRWIFPKRNKADC